MYEQTDIGWCGENMNDEFKSDVELIHCHLLQILIRGTAQCQLPSSLFC